MLKDQVLLVNLPFPFNKYFMIDREVSGSKEYAEHLGLETLASVLRANNISVKIIDALAKKLSVQDIVDEVIRGDYKLVGFSLFDFSSNILGELCDKIKKVKKDIHITSGGHCVTNTYEAVLEKFDNLDSVSRGEGEFTLLELCERVINGVDWHDVRGLAYKQDEKVCLSPARPLIDDLDAMPFPSRDFIDEKVNEGRKIDTMHLYTSRGCYGTCNFCDIKAFYGDNKGQAWRARSPKNVVDEMEYLQKKYNPIAFSICDDNFIGIGNRGKIRAREIANEIIKRELKISFYISCRVDDVEIELFKLLKKAGLTSVFLGVENFSQSELDFFNKFVKYECNCKAIDILKSIDIIPTLGHITFTPYTKLVDISRNIKFLEKYDCVEFFKATFLQRYPGTTFFNNNSSDIFTSEYDVFDHSSFRKPEYKIFDPKTNKLAEFIMDDNWFIYTFLAYSSCVRNYYEKPWSKSSALLHYQNFHNQIKKINFNISLKYIKDLISVLENNNQTNSTTKNIRNEWKKNNALIRKVLVQLNHIFSSKKVPLWKYLLNPNVKISLDNNNYSYTNQENNSFAVLYRESHEMLQNIFKLDYVTSDYIQNTLNMKLDDFYRFMEYLIERKIIYFEDLNISRWKEVSELLHIPESEIICLDINNRSGGSKTISEVINLLTSIDNNKVMLLCDNFNIDVGQDIEAIGNSMQYLGVQMTLDNSCLWKEYADKVDQFIFILTMDDLKEKLMEINQIYEDLKYKMVYNPVFVLKEFKKEDLLDLISIKTPLKINILADKTAYTKPEEVSHLMDYVNRYIDKFPNIGFVYSNLIEVNAMSDEKNKKPHYINFDGIIS